MNNKITVLNIREYLSSKDNMFSREEMLYRILSEYSCEKNSGVERFLKKQAIEFTKKNQSVTYLLFANEDAELIGYFTLAIKPIIVNAKNFSNTVKRKIARVGKLDESSGTYLLPAYLIAQLGKNFSGDANSRISGKQLLQTAIETIKELQYMAGGMVIFLETENKEQLMEFYENQNGFMRFDTRHMENGTDNEHKLVSLLKVM